MRALKFFLFALLLALALGLLLALVTPATLVRPVLSYYLTATGFELTELSGLRVGQHAAAVARLGLQNDEVQLTLHDTTLDYTLSELFAGRLRALRMARLEAILVAQRSPGADTLPTAPTDAEFSRQVQAALQTLDTLPLDNLRIDTIELHAGDARVDIELDMSAQPLRLSAALTTTRFPALSAVIDASRGDGNTVVAAAQVYDNNQSVAQARVEIIPDATGLRIQTNTDINLDALQALVEFLPGVRINTPGASTLTLEIELTATNILNTLAVPVLNITIDNPDHRLLVDQVVDAAHMQLALQLPVQISGAMPSLEAGLALRADFLRANIDYTGPTITGHTELSLDTPALQCSLSLNCTATSTLRAQVTALAAGGVEADHLVLTGEVSAASTPAGLTLTLPELALTTDNEPLTHPASGTTLDLDATLSAASLTCSPTLTCQGSAAIAATVNRLTSDPVVADNLRLGGNLVFDYDLSVLGFTLSDLALELPTLALGDIALRNPSLGGNLSFGNDVLQATLALRIANQLQAQVGLDYSTAAQDGTLQWELPRYAFSRITPLSALVTQSLLETDIVAGSIAGNGTLRVTTDAAGEWQLDGPLTLQLQDLSGFVAESFFVGLHTELLATVHGAGQIQSQSELAARIATLDVGLPLTDIHWNYSFDSDAGRFAIRNLAVTTLGGDISVADFDYELADPRSDLTVVLANLNLQSIVDLAQYPGLEVQGLISGYLPLSLDGTRVTIEEGLVGALQPGGTIRYRSGSPASSNNASLDLVNQALANYHYQIMNTRVYYNEAGDLRLEVQLQGNNPDLYDGQVINLNVNIDDNIPTLLRSLQASRTITDALEQRLQNRQRPGNQ